MRIDERHPQPGHPDVVYDVLWRHFTDLPQRIPHVKAITELSRSDEREDFVRTHHHWQADPSLIPAAARRFVPASLVEWHGHAQWFHRERRVRFRFEHAAFGNLYECDGEFLVEPAAAAAVVVVAARLDLYPERLPGVPAFLARRVAPLVEGVLLNAVRPSLQALPQAVAYFLERRQPAQEVL